ncbi:MAG: phosphoribulokinase [Actinomycetota bacterium]|nr:phosphoribulokinase [Actinomycetota bacterium]
MPAKVVGMRRAQRSRGARNRPRMLAVAGDSAAGKTTLVKGIVEALGPERCTSICVDDYHRYDREERRSLPFTPLHPDCNHIRIMEQHLQLLAAGHPILKPVYDHGYGTLIRPELVEPRDYVIVEGLLPLHTKLSRACFDVSIYLDPPEEIRREWKVRRDTAERGYTAEQVLAELDRREPESAAYIRPQRAHADVVVRFAPIEGRPHSPDTPLSATLLLRPTIPQPPLSEMLEDEHRWTIHLKLVRDERGRPTDALHIHGYAPHEDTQVAKKVIWKALERPESIPATLGRLDAGVHSEPLALTQLLLLYHLLRMPR